MKKNLILIGTGFLGSHLIQEFKNRRYKFINTHFSNFENNGYYLDITNMEKMRDFFIKNKPDIIVNTAGRNDIDFLEKNHDVANSINFIGTKNITTLTLLSCY